MIKLIKNPTEIKEFGDDGKKIIELIGKVNTQTEKLSIAKISSPEGWDEAGQTSEFDEYTVVLKGQLRIETKDEVFNVKADQTIVIGKNTWVRYSTPYKGGAEYMAVCLPAFTKDIANRDK